MRRWREWSEQDRLKSLAHAANFCLNIVPCEDCGLPWAQGIVHDGCPGPKPLVIPDVRGKTCEGANDCEWVGIVLVVPDGGGAWRACREHAAPFRQTEGFLVIDKGLDNRKAKTS